MPCEPYRGGTARGGCWLRSGGLDRGGRAQHSRQGGEVGLMRTRGLRWAGVLLAWAALTPSVGRTQTGISGQTSAWWNRWAAAPSLDGSPSAFLPDDGLPPSVARGQIDTAVGYA